jgi:hypothetical protein
MMRSLLLASLISVSVHAAMAQGMLFRTYEEKASGKGEAFTGSIEVVPLLGRFVAVYTGAEGKVRVPCKDLWGFEYKGVMFRIEPEGYLPVRLMTHGTVCYYENGFAHLQMQRDSTEAAGFTYGHQSYLSKDLQGEIVPAVFTEKDERSSSARFRQAHPEYAALFACIGDQQDMDRTRQCVVDFEVDMEER